MGPSANVGGYVSKEMTLINGGQTPRSLKSNILVVKERVPTLIHPTSKLVYRTDERVLIGN